MTVKAILLGLLGVISLNGFVYFNDHVLHQTSLISNLLPISIFGFLILFVALINPLLKRLHRTAFFSGAELAVMLTMILTSAAIPGSEVYRAFTNILVMPHHIEKLNPEWQDQGLLDMVPDKMLADPGDNPERVVNGFIRGLSSGFDTIKLSETPWSAFVDSFQFWIPMLLVLWLGLLGLSLAVHRQWSRHEQLPYPIARFASAIMPGGDQQDGAPGIFKSGLFWGGIAMVMLIHMNNYFDLWMSHWFQPGSWVPVQLDFNFHSFHRIWPWYAENGGNFFLGPTLYFSVIAFGYFLSKEVSLSLGIGPMLFPIAIGIFKSYGINTMHGSPPALAMTFGAYLGAAGAVLYTGRFYYLQVTKNAFFLPSAEKASPESIWGMRLFIVCAAVLTGMIMSIGVDWPIAVLFVAVTFILYLVIGRIVSETGAFYVQAGIFPVTALMYIFGAQALGPRVILILSIISSVLILSPRAPLMPFFANALKILETHTVKPARGLPLGAVALIVGLAVGLPATLYLQYNFGNDAKDGWAIKNVPSDPFRSASLQVTRLKSQGKLESAMSTSGLARFAKISPDKPHLVVAMVIGLAFVLLFTAGHLRFANWPLHPVLFLIWATFPGRHMAVSFLIGWFIKAAVTKYGGEHGYRKLQPFMFGIVGGDMLGGVIAVLIGVIYFLVNGEAPPIQPFNVFIH
jgi:hypothetical protein